MKILALESSGLTASAAILDQDTLLAEYTVNYKKTHSQTLLPMLEEIVRMTETDLSSIDVLAITRGPGSFTGLRIGAATIKGLGLVLKKPIAAVPTVDALACNFYGNTAWICPMMDARRNQVYTGLYTFSGNKLQVLLEQRAVPVEEILALCKESPQPVIFLGDGVPVYEKQIRESLQQPFLLAPPHLSRQRASSVAVLAAAYAQRGDLISAEAFAPEYLRVSQAERERMERLGAAAKGDPS